MEIESWELRVESAVCGEEWDVESVRCEIGVGGEVEGRTPSGDGFFDRIPSPGTMFQELFLVLQQSIHALYHCVLALDELVVDLEKIVVSLEEFVPTLQKLALVP